MLKAPPLSPPQGYWLFHAFPSLLPVDPPCVCSLPRFSYDDMTDTSQLPSSTNKPPAYRTPSDVGDFYFLTPPFPLVPLENPRSGWPSLFKTLLHFAPRVSVVLFSLSMRPRLIDPCPFLVPLRRRSLLRFGLVTDRDTIHSLFSPRHFGDFPFLCHSPPGSLPHIFSLVPSL